MRSQDQQILSSDIADLLASVGTLRPVVGVVADNGGDTPRMASTILYEVWWNTEEASPLKMKGLRPNDDPPPDTINGKPVETTPLKVGATVFGVERGGSVIRWAANERVAFAECGGAAPSGSTSKKIITGPGGEILPDDGGGDTGGTSLPGQGASDNPGGDGTVGNPR